MKIVLSSLFSFYPQNQNAEYVQYPEDHLGSIKIDALADVCIQKHIFDKCSVERHCKTQGIDLLVVKIGTIVQHIYFEMRDRILFLRHALCDSSATVMPHIPLVPASEF